MVFVAFVSRAELRVLRQRGGEDARTADPTMGPHVATDGSSGSGPMRTSKPWCCGRRCPANRPAPRRLGTDTARRLHGVDLGPRSAGVGTLGGRTGAGDGISLSGDGNDLTPPPPSLKRRGPATKGARCFASGPPSLKGRGLGGRSPRSRTAGIVATIPLSVGDLCADGTKRLTPARARGPMRRTEPSPRHDRQGASAWPWSAIG